MISIAPPYWRLSSFYFFNCAAVGCMLPFWGLYMQSLGYPATQIGFASAIWMATTIFSPPIWGCWADKTGKRLKLIRVGAAASALCFALLLQDRGFFWMVLSIFACGMCWQGINAQFEALTLDHIPNQSANYSRIRLWGSVGFVVAVSGGGWLFDQVQLTVLPMCIVGALAFMWGSTLTVSEPAQSRQTKNATTNLKQLLRQPALLALLLAFTLVYFSHGSYYSFYSIYLKQLQYDKTTMGLLWSLAIVAELLVFALMPSLLKWFSVGAILMFSVLATAIRWLGLAYGAEWLIVLIFCQLLHGFSFSAVHSCAIELIYRSFGQEYQGRGQALYYACCVGIGQASGALISGWLWQISSVSSFVVAALAACVAAMLLGVTLYLPSGSLQLRRRPCTGARE